MRRGWRLRSAAWVVPRRPAAPGARFCTTTSARSLSRDRHRSAVVQRCIEDHAAGRRYPLDAVTTDATVYDPEIKPGA